jgi:hypothetical protein
VFNIIAIILAILWLVCLITGYTLGGSIHVLLVAAAVMALATFITGRKQAE